MSRSKKSTKELARKMYKCSQYGQEENNETESAFDTFYKNLKDFF